MARNAPWGIARRIRRGIEHAESTLLVRWIFLRLLGVIYLVAFVSLWIQVDGLIGSRGVLPARELMTALDEYDDASGIGAARYWYAPTLLWLNASDAMLHIQCALGAIAALLVTLNFLPAPCLGLCWFLYLSLSVGGQIFLGYQWDVLLLETGLIAVLLAPWSMRARMKLAHEPLPSPLAVLLMRWLLFRLYFGSGICKFASQDETWRNLTALSYHYETQPLPTWIGWWAHQLPMIAQRASCLVMFASELALPWLIFTPALARRWAAVGIAVLQVLIALTGNYTFFNLLTLALCLMLLEDDLLLRGRFARWLIARRRGLYRAVLPREHPPCPPVHRLAACGFALLTMIVTFPIMGETIGVNVWRVPLVGDLYAVLYPLRSFNSYGLFANMTTERPEIVIEGTADGQEWIAYEFKWKPGDPARRPGFVAPHQPRLDWQMWFAALGDGESRKVVVLLMRRLLRGEPTVLELLATNPFPDQPPKAVRATLYDYRMTDLRTRRETGDWWRREPRGLFYPPIMLDTAIPGG